MYRGPLRPLVLTVLCPSLLPLCSGLHRDATRALRATEDPAHPQAPTMTGRLAPSTGLQTYLSYYSAMWPLTANPPAPTPPAFQFHQPARHDLRREGPEAGDRGHRN